MRPHRSGTLISVMIPPYDMNLTDAPLSFVSVNRSTAVPSLVVPNDALVTLAASALPAAIKIAASAAVPTLRSQARLTFAVGDVIVSPWSSCQMCDYKPQLYN